MEQFNFNPPPVLLLMFNRPHMAAQVFEKVRQVRPPKLFIAVDGARPDHPGEAEKVRQCQAFKDKVDWECDLKVNFAETNMNCKNRVSSGITWAFEHVEELMILEEDCVPDLSFFRFCREMLDKYRDDNRIFSVVGSNQDYCEPFDESYAFSRRFYCWGWATWKRAWSLFDLNMKKWSKFRQDKYFRNVLRKYDRDDMEYKFQRTYEGKINAWDYPYYLISLVNHGLHIVPRVNLVRNIGFEPGGTNTMYPVLPHLYMDEEIKFPLIHPDIMSPLNRLLVPPTFPENALERAEFQKKIDAILTDYDNTFQELLKLGQYHAVKIFFKKLLRDDRLPRSLTQYHLNCVYYVALAYFNLGDYEHAEAMMNILLMFNPRNLNILQFMANISLHRNDSNKAHEIFKTMNTLKVADIKQKT